MTTPAGVVPLSAIEALYFANDGSIPVTLKLLDASVTSIAETAYALSDLSGVVAGVTFTDTWPVYADASAGVFELSLPSRAWSSTGTATATFRWVVVLADTQILSAVDFGSVQSLSAAHLALYANESTYIPGSYPILRWRRA